MGRPRRASDSELIDRISDALARRASAEPWSLNDVAPAAGISAAGLIKRFGSKELLLHALTRRWIDLIPDGSGAGTDEPALALAELRAYAEAHFGTTSSTAATIALGELMRDLWSADASALLREGWQKQASYFEALLSRLPARAGVDRHVAALTLFDALHGSLYRRAVGFEPTSPTQTIDNLLKEWT